MTISSANRTQANASTEEMLAVDVSDIIWHVGEPTEAPLMTLKGGGLYKKGLNKPEDVPGKMKSEGATEVSYKIIEKDPLSRVVQVNGAVADTTTTTITLDANTNLRVGDTIKNITQPDGEVCLVFAVDSGGADISARRNLGSTSFTVADNDQFRIVGYASKEGGAKASLKSQLAAPRTRYCQIFKRSFGITDTLRNIVLETKAVDAWDEESTQAMVEHKKDIEYSFWMNAAADSSTDSGANTVYTTRGIIKELAGDDYTINCNSPSEGDFFGQISEKIFEYGPARKTLFLDSRGKSIFGDWSRVKQQTKPYDTKYGISIVEIETNHGILELVTCGAFNFFFPDSMKGFGVVLDLDRVVYKHIKNRDSKFEDAIQTPGTDAREAQYITEAGISLRSLKHHKVLKGLA